MKMRYISLVPLVLAFILIFSILPVSAEDSPTIDWSGYSYEELLSTRDALNQCIEERERQYAIENGNRILTLNETDITVYQGESFDLAVEVKRVVEDAPETTELIWTSSDETVAKVSKSGAVTGVGSGEAVITCAAADDAYIFAEASVHVVLPVTKLSLDAQEVTLLLPEKDPSAVKQTLKYTVEPEDAYVKDVIWTSSEEAIAEVDENGTIQAVAPGTVTITATSKDTISKPASASCEVTVLQAVQSITLEEPALTLNVSSKQDLAAAVMPETASRKTVEWTSSDPDVASVSKDGRVSALTPGLAHITCTAADGSGTSAACEVTVIQLVQSLKIEGESTVTVNKGDTLHLRAFAVPENATNPGVTWESSDPSTAAVDENGVVTALNGGGATITCTAVDGSQQTAKISVYIPSIATDTFTYSVNSKSGKTISFQYYGKKEDLSFTQKNTKLFDMSMDLSGEQGSLTISPRQAGTTTVTLKDKADKRNTVTLTITVGHSACYDTTSYPAGNYTAILRTPSQYKDTPMSAYGRVLQVSDGLFYKVMRVATQGRWDNVFYITCFGDTADGIIEGDWISIYGECTGTETYKTIMGASVTIPAITAEKIFFGRN